jgi:hypothetical protein
MIDPKKLNTHIKGITVNPELIKVNCSQALSFRVGYSCYVGFVAMGL